MDGFSYYASTSYMTAGTFLIRSIYGITAERFSNIPIFSSTYKIVATYSDGQDDEDQFVAIF